MAEAKNRRKKKFLSLRWQYILSFLGGAVLIGTLAFLRLVVITVIEVEEQLQQDLLQVMEGAAAGVDVDMLLSLAQDGEVNAERFSDDPRYLELTGWLDTMHQAEPDAWPYLYIAGENPGEIVYVVDLISRYEPENAAGFLETYRDQSGFLLSGLESQTFRTVESPTVHAVRTWAEKRSNPRLTALGSWLADLLDATPLTWDREFGTYEADNGRWASGYQPLVNADGEKVAAIGVNFKAEVVDVARESMIRKIAIIFLMLFPLVLIAGHLLMSIPSRPILALSNRVKQFGEDPSIESISIKRGAIFRDEVDNLVEVLNTMIEQIRRREKLYHAVISAQNSLILRWDTDGNYTFFNQAVRDAFGDFETGNMYEATVTWLYEEDRDRILDIFMSSLSGFSKQVPESSFEARFNLKDGSVRWFKWTTKAIFDGGQLDEYQSVGQDIHESKLVQEVLEKTNARLQQISHQFLNAREQERINLARDLHDDVLNYLSVMLMEIDGPISLETMRTHCQVITNRLRETIYELRPSMLNYGLYLGLQDYTEDLQKRAGEQVDLDFQEDPLPPWCAYPEACGKMRLIWQ